MEIEPSTMPSSPPTTTPADEVNASTTALLALEEDDAPTLASSSASIIFRNFVLMSIFFSLHHGCVVSCLSLATARLGADVGATQSSILYLSYTGCALFGATFLVKRWGAHRSLTVGMTLYCFYVAAFGISATLQSSHVVAYVGAFLGGLGAGVVWIAQGSFFAQSAAAAASGDSDTSGDESSNNNSSTATARMAGIFAFFYLALELLLRSLSSLASWTVLFQIYFVATLLATAGMVGWVRPPEKLVDRGTTSATTLHTTYAAASSTTNDGVPDTTLDDEPPVWYQLTAALQLWKPNGGRQQQRPTIMPYLLGLNAVFGLESAFLNAYIHGQVVPHTMIGGWTAYASGVAALWSLVLGKWTGQSTDNDGPTNHSNHNRKGWVLSAGAVCFASVVLPFAIRPNVATWAFSASVGRFLVFFLIYTLHGTGRATFEGTLKATFADFFPYEKEGAFANIILQNGLSTSLGYFLTARLSCSPSDTGNTDPYCVPYKDGTYHHMGWMETFILVVAVLAVAGYWKAAQLVRQEATARSTNGLRNEIL